MNGSLTLEELKVDLEDLLYDIQKMYSEENSRYERVNLLLDIVENGIDLKKSKNSDKYKRKYIEEEDIIRSEVISEITGFFIRELVDNSLANINNYESQNDKSECNNRPIIDCKVIGFNDLEFLNKPNKEKPEIKNVLEGLKDLISSKIINSYEVNCFDGKAIYIVNKLFKAYYSNPLQLPDNTLDRIDREIKRFDNKWVNIRNGSNDEVSNQLEVCKGIEETKNRKRDEIKHKIFMRSIADFIAGMTDNFAKNQFEKLYLP